MQKLDDIKIKLIDYQNELGDSRLEFKIMGKSINYVVMNTIRRTIFSDIPIYAFDNIKIDKNSSIYHNNYLKVNLYNMPVWGIDHTLDYINKKSKIINEIINEENDETEDDVDLEDNKKIKMSSMKEFTMYINIKNTTNENITVSTQHAKFYYDEKNIDSPYKHHIPITKLKPNQEINLAAISQVGTEIEDAKYSAVCINCYKQIKDDEFDYIIESRGQLSEKRIIEIGLINIERHLLNFKKLIDANEDINNDNIQGLITVNDLDHTLGNLITKGMQQHKHIDFAGYNLQHPLLKIIHFHYKLNKGNIKTVLTDVCDYYIELFNDIKKTLKKSLS